MRVSPVGNFNQKRNITFGKFADNNAKRVVQKTLATDDWVMKPVYDSWFQRIQDCDFFEAYTDEKDGKVKGRFDDECTKNEDIAFYVKSMKKFGDLDDLSVFTHLTTIADRIYDFKKIMAGVDIIGERVEMMKKIAQEDSPYGDYAAMRAEEEAYR